MVAVISMAQTEGLDPRWVRLFGGFFALVLTDRRFLKATFPKNSETPRDLEEVSGREGLTVAEWKPGMLQNTIVLEHEGKPVVNLKVPRLHRAEGEEFVAALR